MLFMHVRKPLLLLSQISFAIAALTLIAPAMHATPITYNLTLTETDGNGTKYSGTGQVTLDVTGGIKNFVGYTTSTGLTAMNSTSSVLTSGLQIPPASLTSKPTRTMLLPTPFTPAMAIHARLFIPNPEVNYPSSASL